MATEQDVTEKATEPEPDKLELEPEQQATEPDERELEPVELDPDELAEIEREVLEEFASSEEEEPIPKPKRVRIKAAPKAAAPKATPKAAPKKRGRPPGSRNVVRAPIATPAPRDPMEVIMTSMRERRQAHQERQHMFFKSFLP